MVKRDFSSISRRGVAEIIVEEEFSSLLEEGRPLRLKMGFDPSRPDIHLGHVVGLRKLHQLQQLGHQVILIVGDWTAQIGDPSGQSATRPMLTADEVRQNAETYMEQFFKVVDKEHTQVRWQSEWFGKFGLGDIIKLTSKFTVAQLLARDDFNKRYKEGKPIAVTEFLYPLLQAYDSVVIEADVEFGGTDQKFNILLGRELQEVMGQRPQQVFLTPILVGTDGSQRMSKSLGNYIGITDPPNDMYGKMMSLRDELIMDYFELVTDVSDDELKEFQEQLAHRSVNPMELKKHLAREVVAQFHGAQAASAAERNFTQVFQQRELPEDVLTIYLSFQALHSQLTLTLTLEQNDVKREKKVSFGDVGGIGVIHEPGHEPPVKEEVIKVYPADLLFCAELVQSKSEARRLLAEGAVDVDGKKVTGDTIEIRDGSMVKVGKRRFAKIVNSDNKSPDS